MDKVWFITGSNRGLGRAFAQEAISKGDKVIAAMRTYKQDDPFYLNEHVLPVTMDVTDKAQVSHAVQKGLEKFGRIDIVVNNAGFGYFGAFEECTEQELRNLFETNFFGVVNVLKAAIPIMRKQLSGRIVNISSRSGVIGEAGCTPYNAVKFAISGISEGLNEELSDFGIQVMAVCPGGFRTDFRDSSSKKEPATLMQEYEGKLGHRALIGTRNGNHKQIGDPKKAAELLYQTVTGEQMPIRLVLGKDACDDIIAKLQSDIEEIRGYYDLSCATAFDS